MAVTVYVVTGQLQLNQNPNKLRSSDNVLGHSSIIIMSENMV